MKISMRTAKPSSFQTLPLCLTIAADITTDSSSPEKIPMQPLLQKFKKCLNSFLNRIGAEVGLPTVKQLATSNHFSPSYLSDLLKKETGLNAQDTIHYYLIEEAKQRLHHSSQSVSEIAYQFGFEYPQYFNKLFKSKTGQSPGAFRQIN